MIYAQDEIAVVEGMFKNWIVSGSVGNYTVSQKLCIISPGKGI